MQLSNYSNNNIILFEITFINFIYYYILYIILYNINIII